MVGENNFMGRIMGVFMDMDKPCLVKDFEKGLSNLKVLAEKRHADGRTSELAANTVRTVTCIETVDRTRRLVFIGTRNKKVKWSDMTAFFGDQLPCSGCRHRGCQPGTWPVRQARCMWAWNEKDQTADHDGRHAGARAMPPPRWPASRPM
jgi:hypothetical protein